LGCGFSRVRTFGKARFSHEATTSIARVLLGKIGAPARALEAFTGRLRRIRNRDVCIAFWRKESARDYIFLGVLLLFAAYSAWERIGVHEVFAEQEKLLADARSKKK
jgi:hypothetical protein